jgi:hypothetical protein
VNDAKAWAAVLKVRGFEVRSLLNAAATRKAMVAELKDLVDSGQKGDTLVFTYSGHGSWVPDKSGDEADARDEALCPCDIAKGKGHFIVDDDLSEIFARKQTGVRVFFISDSCHSGTVARFMPSLGPAPRAATRVRFLPPEVFLKGTRLRAAVRRLALSRATRQKYPALLAAGCRDDEYSYDAAFGGKPSGAFTHFAIKALARKPKSPRAWMTAIRKALPSREYAQSPQLYGSTAAKDGRLF